MGFSEKYARARARPLAVLLRCIYTEETANRYGIHFNRLPILCRAIATIIQAPDKSFATNTRGRARPSCPRPHCNNSEITAMGLKLTKY